MRRLLRVLIAVGVVCAIPARPGAGPRIADERGFRFAVPPYAFTFPRDHASHPDYAVEWWYYTGHLAHATRTWGYELTFFRVGLTPPHEPLPTTSAWRVRDVLFAHLALTDERGGRFEAVERVRRPAGGEAGADTTRYRTWIGDWSARLAPDGRTHQLRARSDAFEFALELRPTKPPVSHGEQGVSQKAAGIGNASHYYSLTRLATSGRLRAGADTFVVTGQSWMDHEYGSGRLASTHAGWDWFSVQLDDGRELMLYQLRRKDGSIEPMSSGTWIERDGRARRLTREAFAIRPLGRWRSPATAGEYPSGWRVSVPSEGLELTIEPTVRAQEFVAQAMGGVAYWEGSCRVTGRGRSGALTGRAYAELTGYAGATPF